MRPCLAAALLVLGLLFAAGCVSKSKARAQAEAAYRAGQKQAVQAQQQWMVERANPQATATTVTFRGAVRNPAIEWTAGLTLSQAILQAGYSGLGDPRIILLHRQGQTHTIQTSQLLRGTQDLVLEAGDMVDLVP